MINISIANIPMLDCNKKNYNVCASREQPRLVSYMLARTAKSNVVVCAVCPLFFPSNVSASVHT